jgi:hypothetical protein
VTRRYDAAGIAASSVWVWDGDAPLRDLVAARGHRLDSTLVALTRRLCEPIDTSRRATRRAARGSSR